MAIAKVRSHRVEWSAKSLGQLAVAGALILLSLIMAWFAIARFQLKRNMYAGIRAADRNDKGNVLTPLQSALSWKSDHHAARLVLAKALTDAGEFAQAEAEYTTLLSSGFDKPHLANVGLGVVALRRADRESRDAKNALKPDALKVAEPHLKAARDRFKAAGGIAEARIGAAHADLLEAIIKGDGARVSALKGEFIKLHGEAKKSGAEISKEGLIDLYAGLGFTHASGGVFSQEAADYFNGCYQYAPQWPLPLINRVYVEAQRFAQVPMEQATLTRDKSKIEQQRSDWQTLWSTSTDPAFAGLKEAWYQYAIALCYRFNEAGDRSLFENSIYYLKTTDLWAQRHETWRLYCGVYMRQATRLEAPDVETKNTWIMGANVKLDEYLNRGEPKDATPRSWATYAIALINKGFCLEQQGERDNNDTARGQAIQKFTEALKIEKEKLGMPDGSYEANRNLAVMLKRQNKPEAAQHFEAAKRAVTDARRGDLAELEKYMAGK